jgi:FixJ family two-component response regulator
MNVIEGLVYIVDDDQSFRKSLQRLIAAAGFETIALESAGAFLAQVPIRHPACLLLDVDLPDLDGIRLQNKLLEQGVHLPIVFITGRGNIPMSVKAMKAGALDFLTKPFASDELLKAVADALVRDTNNMAQANRQQQVESLISTLTDRETEILRWVISGKLNKEIASALAITEKTVKVHRSHVMEKLRVSSVAELVRLAEQAHIDPADSATA